MSVPGLTAYELSMQRRTGSPVVEAPLPRTVQEGDLPNQVLDQRPCPIDSGQTQMGKNGQEKEDDQSFKPYFERQCEIFDRFLPKLEMNTAKRWSQLSTVLQEFDDNQSKTNNENIDTLLVFAGLFSAILTAFIVEAIKLLQQDSADISVQVLMQISQQLSSFSINPGFINSTHNPVMPPPTFTPTTSSLWINALWIAALIFSLITGSLGMLVKQWLREYQSNSRVSPEEHRRVRLFRIRGLRKYGVLEIASFLPLLLQIALILFFVGLALFVFEVHPSIGWLVLAIVTVWFLFLGGTTILPIFSPSCPYKTPFLKAAILRFRLLLNSLYPKVLSTLHRIKVDAIRSGGSERKLFVEEVDIAQNAELDFEVQLDARDTFRDIKVWEMIACCVDPESLPESLTKLVAIVEKKSGSPVGPLSNLRECFGRDEWDLLLQSMITCLRKIFLDVPSSGLRDVDLQALIAIKDGSTYGPFALRIMTSYLLRGAFSVPWQTKPLRTLILWKLGFPYAVLPIRIENRDTNFIYKASTLLLDAQDYGLGMSKFPLPNIIELCCTVFHCAARCDTGSLDPLKSDFLHLTSSLVDVLTAITPPSEPHPVEVFRCHYALDIAMRTHKQVPGIISESLLEALHLHSVKMFDTIMKFNEECLQEGPVDISQAPIRPSGEIDWNKIIEDRVEIDVRDPGDYGDRWEYWRTRFDCKHRMEFMLRFEGIWGKELREVLTDS